MKTYTGLRTKDGCVVFVQEDALTGSESSGRYTLKPERSQKVYNHSPDGFEWGYAGSGPAQLALAILLDCLTDKRDAKIAEQLYQDFKFQVVCQMPRTGWELAEAEIELWISASHDKSNRYFKAKWDGSRGSE